VNEAPQPRIGLWGRSRTLGSAGRIVEVSGRTGRVTLETDGVRMVLPGDDVEIVDEPIAVPAPHDTEVAELRQRAASRIAHPLAGASNRRHDGNTSGNQCNRQECFHGSPPACGELIGKRRGG